MACTLAAGRVMMRTLVAAGYFDTSACRFTAGCFGAVAVAVALNSAPESSSSELLPELVVGELGSTAVLGSVVVVDVLGVSTSTEPGVLSVLSFV